MVSLQSMEKFGSNLDLMKDLKVIILSYPTFFVFVLIKNAKLSKKMIFFDDNMIFKVVQKSLDLSVSSSKTKLVLPESHGALLRLIHMKCKSWDRNTIRNHVTL